MVDINLPEILSFERPSGGEDAISQAAQLLSDAEFPVILNGAGVVIGGAIPASMALAERLDAPVCCGYQHNDAFPGSHPLFAGPLGYNGSKAGMELIAKADVVLALGTRLNRSPPAMALITGRARPKSFRWISILTGSA